MPALLEDFGAFGWLRGIRDRAIMLEIRHRDGRVPAFGYAWLDAGTSSSLHDASAYVQTVERRAGIKIGCPEEAAFRRGFLPLAGLESWVARLPKCEYREYLAGVVSEARRPA